MVSFITFVYLNVRSLQTGFQSLKEFILKADVDVFGITESWLRKDIPSDHFTIIGYNLIRNDRETRGGGIAFYVKKCYLYEIIFSHTDECIEQLWISIKLIDKIFIVGVIYRPPQSNVLKFLNSLEDSIANLLPLYDYLIVGGDFNINILEHRADTDNLLVLLNSYNLVQLVGEPTRITNEKQSLLDLIIAPEDLKITNVETFDLNGVSDHLATVCKIHSTKVRSAVKLISRRDYSTFEEVEFNADISRQNWNQIYSLTDVNSMLNFLNETLGIVFNIHAPIRTFRVTKPPAPWLTYNIKQIISLRDKAHKKFRKTRSINDWKYYTELRNYTTGAIRREQKAYMEFILRQKNTKATWNTLRSLEVLRSNRQNIIPDHLRNVDQINHHFVNIMSTEKNNDHHAILNKYNVNPPQNKFHFHTVDTIIVSKCLHRIHSNAIGADNISLRMLLLSEPHILEHITFIFNTIIITNIYPDIWKLANIIPLVKCADPQEFSHLRPISILCTLSKAFELVLNDQINEFDQCHNIIPNIQSGFRTNHSTVTALQKITSDIMQAIDNKTYVCLTLLDYSQAFNMLDFDVMRQKLKYFGFSDNAVDLINNYLRCRRQRVILDGQSSDLLPVESGVPQGSVIGPKLFSLYISDFHEFISHCHIHHFADDTQKYFFFKSQETEIANRAINNDLNTLKNVSTAHNLRLNSSKCTVMLFGSKSKYHTVKTSLKFNIGEEQLQFVDEAKNLGIWFDINLRFSKHVSYLCQQSFNVLRQLYPSRRILSSKLKLSLCESLIISKLSYCDTVYGPALTKKDETRLQRIQNSCIRFAYGIRKFDHLSGKFCESGWLKLRDLRKLHTLTQVHKILISQQPSYLYNHFEYFGNRGRQSRHSRILIIPKHTSAMYTRSFIYTATKLYNSIPNTFKHYSIVNFKKRIKVFLRD